MLSLQPHARSWTGKKMRRKLPKTYMQERSLDVMDCAYWWRRRSLPAGRLSRKTVAKRLWCDSGQGVARKPWGVKKPAACQNSRPYSFEKNVCLSAHDVMRLHGHPRLDELAPDAEVSDSQLRSLAGEGFTLPCIGLFLYSF